MGMDIVELIMETEDYFDVKISAVEAELLHTVGDIHQLICKKLTAKINHKANSPIYQSAEVFEILKKIIERKIGISIEKINYSAKIVGDLRID